ncbi:lyase family protein [Mycobacterium sp.]|uniref:lyase family protein n=1 Tax=Mycobacterium sp. TaxID=1785 RepID=UPI003A870AC2
MTNLLWPGDERAGEHMTDRTLLASMTAVETAWLDALIAAGLVPVQGGDLGELIGDDDCERIAAAGEDGGNPVIGLVSLLRDRAAPALGRWIHCGLTSQDVLDTALMLAARAAVDQLLGDLAGQIRTVSELAAAHRDTPMLGRTLTQHAAPTTFGAKAAGWLNGLVDAYRGLAAADTPAQFGGAVGTRAAAVELAAGSAGGSAAGADLVEVAEDVARHATAALGLTYRLPWHTTRTPVTALGDALTGCTDAWGRIAADVVTLARPEIAELSEPAGDRRGISSCMPHKRNPVLSILIRRAAVAAPPLAGTLHTSAALANDERPDGAWHTEWDTLRILVRRTVAAGAQCGELLAGLGVHARRMAENLGAADVLGEQRAVADLTGRSPSATYLGAAARLVDVAVERAQQTLQGRPG